MPDLSGARIAFLAADGVEEVELTGPWEAVRAAGGAPELVSPGEGEILAFRHLEHGRRFPVDRAVGDARAEDYDGMVQPGGVANPDFLRGDPAAVRFVRAFAEAGKPVAAICHGPWTLVEADAVRGRTLTSWPTLRTDIVNAGGTWVDREVVVDGNLVTSRRPGDLPAFCAAMIEAFAASRARAGAAR